MENRLFYREFSTCKGGDESKESENGLGTKLKKVILLLLVGADSFYAAF